MIGKRGPKAVLLAIIFGVPVAWYLFLQFFGSNEFELPVVRQLSSTCVEEQITILLLQTPKTASEENQLNRIKQNTLTSSLVKENMVFEQDCDFGSGDLVFVDDMGQVRGEYVFNLEDIDRLITEVELFYTIRAEDGTDN